MRCSGKVHLELEEQNEKVPGTLRSVPTRGRDGPLSSFSPQLLPQLLFSTWMH